jgi:methylase of polypeptide subunit release factors
MTYDNQRKSTKKHYKRKPYKPFSKNTEFISYVDRYDNIKELENVKLGYSLIPFNYVPKTGILLCQYLNQISHSVLNSNILDVGTGETALLAIHSAMLGANKIVAIDVDTTTLRWAKKNVKVNNLNNKIIIKKIPLHKYKTDFKFDIIISNPPQMPVEKIRSLHDDGGRDGKLYIKGIIKLANQYLKDGGNLIFTAFDFLGVNRSYNDQSSIFGLLKKYSFLLKIVKKITKEIKPDSYTAKNMRWIKTKYPKYIFRKNKNGLYCHKIFIISARKI